MKKVHTSAQINLSQLDKEQSEIRYSKSGYLLIEQAFDRRLIQKLGKVFENEYSGGTHTQFARGNLKLDEGRFMCTIALKKPFLDPRIYAAPKVLPLVKGILGEDAILQGFGVAASLPGATMQRLHSDYPILFAEAGGLNAMIPSFCLQVMIPLMDLDESCGTTAVWEGSHRTRNLEQLNKHFDKSAENLEGATIAYPKMGDCFLMDSRALHLGTPNLSDRVRPILFLLLSRPWFIDNINYSQQPRLIIEQVDLEKIPQKYAPLFQRAHHTELSTLMSPSEK